MGPALYKYNSFRSTTKVTQLTTSTRHKQYSFWVKLSSINVPPCAQITGTATTARASIIAGTVAVAGLPRLPLRRGRAGNAARSVVPRGACGTRGRATRQCPPGAAYSAVGSGRPPRTGIAGARATARAICATHTVAVADDAADGAERAADAGARTQGERGKGWGRHCYSRAHVTRNTAGATLAVAARRVFVLPGGAGRGGVGGGG